MVLRLLALMALCVLLLGCGLEGPVPTDTKSAGGRQGQAMPSTAPVDRSASTPHKTDSLPLDAKDAPYVEGRIVIIGPLADKRIGAGFVGKGADGKRYSIEAEADFTPGNNSRSATGIFELPSQRTSAFENGPDGPGYSHVKMPPGDYLVYLKHGCVMLAWKKVTVKPGDRLTVDLTIDAAKTGSIVVAWPDDAKFGADNRPLSLIPAELDGCDLIPSNVQTSLFVPKESKTLTLNGVPAGKYHVCSGFISADVADVEVKPDKEVTVKLPRESVPRLATRSQRPRSKPLVKRETFDGFSFELPDGWTRVPPARPKTKATLLLGPVPRDMPRGKIPASSKGMIQVDAGRPQFPSPNDTAAAFAKEYGGEVLSESVAVDGERGIAVRISSHNAALMPRRAIIVGRKGWQYMIMAGSVEDVDVSNALDQICKTWKWEE